MSEETRPAYLESAERLREKRRAEDRFPFHGGRLLGRALSRLGARQLFTLSGGHLFPIYDGCVESLIPIIDMRHEEAAVHAAEAWSKLTRTPGVAAVTAGPGVTNAVTGIAAAYHNRTPLLVIGGRAPDYRWGQGSLQEMDHIPLLSAITKKAVTVHDPARLHIEVADCWSESLAGAPGPTFLDAGIDVLMNSVEESQIEWPEVDGSRQRPDDALVDRAAALLRKAERPLIIAGSGAYWDHAEEPLQRLAEEAELPVYANGLGRGLLPADHPCFFSRSRREGLGAADVVLLLGAPLDFRLNFGQSPPFAGSFKLIRVDCLDSDLNRNVVPEVGIAADMGETLTRLAQLLAQDPGPRQARTTRLAELRQREDEATAKDRADLEAVSQPIHPMRVYGELLKVLDRDSVVIGDGGDFVSYAGRVVPTFLPGHFIDPGPFGGLGMGPASAIAARLAFPDKQIVLLLGDGAFGFGGMEFDTMVRHKLPVVAIVGNNNAWGLEKHPMEMLFGWSVAAELNPGARYDKVVEALGGHGEYVTRPEDIAPALRRAFDSGQPALVNVACDPSLMYPRSANLA